MSSGNAGSALLGPVEMVAPQCQVGLVRRRVLVFFIIVVIAFPSSHILLFCCNHILVIELSLTNIGIAMGK